jgi:hypothetical protein
VFYSALFGGETFLSKEIEVNTDITCTTIPAKSPIALQKN